MSVRQRLRDRLQRLLARLSDEDRDALTIVGGTAPALYDIPETVTLRPTKDIDVVIEAVTYVQWHRFVGRLEDIGFRHRADEDEPICRYAEGDLVVDIMATDANALGLGAGGTRRPLSIASWQAASMFMSSARCIFSPPNSKHGRRCDVRG